MTREEWEREESLARQAAHLKLEKKTARKALRKTGGGPKRELSPALQLWRSILAAKGISGVLRKDDARYGSIKREFEIAKATL